MPLKTLLAAPFSHVHEDDMFRALRTILENALSQKLHDYLLIGNPVINNCEPDALLFGPSSISVIEMKNHSGAIVFSENGPWTADGREVKGGNTVNPFRQIRANRYALIGWFNKHLPSFDPKQRTLGHVSAVVLFADQVTCTAELPPDIKPWFHICGLPNAADILLGLQSNLLSLGISDYESILSKMGLRWDKNHELSPKSPRRFDPPPETEIFPTKVVMLKESEFTSDLIAAREQVGEVGPSALRLADDLNRLSSTNNPLASYDRQKLEGIESCFRYRVSNGLYFAAFVFNDSLLPMAVGGESRIATWQKRHLGTALVINPRGKLVLTSVAAESAGMGETFDPSEKAFFDRLPEFDLESHVGSKARLLRDLRELGPTSSNEEIEEVIDLISNEAVAVLIRDLIRLLAANNIEGAKSRIALHTGDACPAVDVPETLNATLSSGENADVAAPLDLLHPRDRERFFGQRRLIEWIIYPHPDQIRIATRNYSRPVVLEGVSGSGKTCILIHRARYLANKYPGERIGVLTLNRALSGFLENLIAEVCSEEERRHIVVMSFYDYFASLLKEFGMEKYFSELKATRDERSSLHRTIDQIQRDRMVSRFSPERNKEADEAWFDMMTNEHSDFREWIAALRKYLEDRRVDAERYMYEEATLIRSALTLPERKQVYMENDGFRNGRGIPFTKELRRDMLHVLSLYEEYLLSDEALDTLELTQALTPCWPEIRALPPEKRFRCVLVDEFQDLSTLDLRLLTHVPTAAENGLFLAGDTVQKILVKKTNLGDAGLGQGNVTSVEIKKNFRNSRQILQAASKLANHFGKMASRMGEPVRYLDPELAERVTHRPIALKVNDQVLAAWSIVGEMHATASDYWNVCIATADPKRLPPLEILRFAPDGIEPSMLSGNYINMPKSVVISTLDEIKGFEFKTVVILGLDRERFPDPQNCQDEIWRDALRLYVAMTRACDHAYLVYSEEASLFLEHMSDDLRWDTLTIEKSRSPKEMPETQQMPLSEAAIERINKVTGSVVAQKTCKQWFSEHSIRTLEALHRLKMVQSKSKQSFDDWLTPTNLRKLSVNDFYKLRNVGRQKVTMLVQEMERNGVKIS